MPRKKVRFFAKVEGKDREVFAVGEGADGDLAIMRRAETGLMADPSKPAEVIDFIEHRVSIHISRESKNEATTIVHTQVTGSGNKESGSALVKYSRENLLWPVYSLLCPNLSHDRYHPSAGKTKKVVYLSNDVPPLDCLMYHIFAVGPEREPPDIFQCTKYIEQFSNLKIVVYVNYLNMPSAFFGSSATLHTSDVRIDGETTSSGTDFGLIFPEGGVSFSDEDVRKFLSDVSHKLAFRFIDATMKLPGIGQENIDYLKNHKVYFSVLPLSVSGPTLLINQPPERWIPPTQE